MRINTGAVQPGAASCAALFAPGGLPAGSQHPGKGTSMFRKKAIDGRPAGRRRGAQRLWAQQRDRHRDRVTSSPPQRFPRPGHRHPDDVGAGGRGREPARPAQGVRSRQSRRHRRRHRHPVGRGAQQVSDRHRRRADPGHRTDGHHLDGRLRRCLRSGARRVRRCRLLRRLGELHRGERHQVGVPWYVDTRVVFYRKDLAEQAGYYHLPDQL